MESQAVDSWTGGSWDAILEVGYLSIILYSLSPRGGRNGHGEIRPSDSRPGAPRNQRTGDSRRDASPRSRENSSR